MQLAIESTILESLLARAAHASRLVGYIDERAGDTIVKPLGDSVDEIVHVLSELLGNPHVVARVPSACSSFATETITRDVAIADSELVVLGGAR
jgi:uncharacterized Fe-S cluster-containing protein